MSSGSGKCCVSRANRPIAPEGKRGLGQILCPAELKVGQCYWVYNADGSRETIRLESWPFQREGTPWIKVGYDYHGQPMTYEASLADMGISPYENELYNPTNFTVIDP